MRREIKEIDIVGSSTFSRYKKQSSAETFNMFISDNALIDYAGYKKMLSISSNGQSRNIFQSPQLGQMLVVIGNMIYTVTADLIYIPIGTLRTRTGDAYMAENNNRQIAVSDRRNLFVYDYNPSVNAGQFVENLDFTPGHITAQDGYIISTVLTENGALTNEWRLSLPGDAFTWPDEYIGALEGESDVTVGVFKFRRQLFIFGNHSTEIWYDVGGRIFPYQRSNTTSIDYGCLNVNTIAQDLGYIIWVGSSEKSDAAILVSTGGTPKAVSTDGLDYRLGQLEHPEDSTAFIFQQSGHVFYHLTFFTDNYSLIYDLTASRLYTITDENRNYHIAKDVVFFNNRHYFISLNDGDIYELNDKYFTYDYRLSDSDDSSLNRIIPRSRLCSPFRMPNNSRFRTTNLSVIQETGANPLRTPQGTEPDVEYLTSSRIGHSMSKDGGQTFTDANIKELPRSGVRQNMVRFHNGGMANEIVDKFEWWTAGPVVALGATREIFQ